MEEDEDYLERSEVQEFSRSQSRLPTNFKSLAEITMTRVTNRRQHFTSTSITHASCCFLYLLTIVSCQSDIEQQHKHSSRYKEDTNQDVNWLSAASPFDWRPLSNNWPSSFMTQWHRLPGDTRISSHHNLDSQDSSNTGRLSNTKIRTKEKLPHSRNQSRGREARQINYDHLNDATSNKQLLNPPSRDHVNVDHHASSWVRAAYNHNLQYEPQSLILQQSARGSEDNVETFYIRKGANGTLPCLPVLPADSKATQNKIEWFKEEKKLMEAEAKRIVVWNTKNSIAYLPDTGALFFRGVTNGDSGEYHCVLTKTTSSSDDDGSSEDGIVRFYVQDVPDPPQEPLVTGQTQHSVNLSWAPPYDYHYSPILHYIIHIREGVDGKWDVANGIMTPDNRTHYETIGLKPFTTYQFRVLAVNAIGVSEPSHESYLTKTLRQRPDSRLNIVSAKNVSSSAIRLDWEPPSPKEIHGEFLGYRIRYVPQLPEHSPPVPSNSSSHSSASLENNNLRYQSSSLGPIRQPTLDGPLAREVIVGDTKETSYTIKGLQTYTLYRISVQVSNPAGDGPVVEALAMTDEGQPSAPLNVTVLKSTDTTVKLRWSEPESPNGILQHYQIVLHDIGSNLNETHKLTDPQSVMEHTFTDLKPYTWYLVHIQAHSRKFSGDISQQVKFRTDVSAPSAPLLTNVTCFSQDSILILWQRPENYYNQIDYYYVRYKQVSGWGAGENKEEETAMSAKKDKLLNELLITNLTAEKMYELKALAGTRSIHDPGQIYRSEPSQTFRVVLQANCESYTAYPITENTFNTSLAIGVVCASFALALVTVSLIVWRRHCQAAYYYLDEPQDASRGTNSPQLSETYDDSEYGSIIVNDWAKHTQKLHADGDIGFSREFEQIQQANQKNTALTCDHSQLAENKHKNRYINIVAYDHTRVILRPPLGGQKKSGFDYINANFIDGYNKPRAYIGTQGPLVSTFDDYWRMIWEQRVVIIVMITNLQERGRRKCDMYWPKEGTETYGYVQVKLLQEVVMATYTLRTFTVKNLKMKKRAVGSERTVYQYHYTNWPDHGVPDHPLPVLSFVRKSAAANPPGAGAIICHCSAGCGRSGTYIVIDAMLKQIRHRQSINVVDFLKHIRTQRNYLVQTEEQYVFIHDALVEAIESGETEIPSNFIAKYLQLLQTGGTGCKEATLSTQKGSIYSLVNGGLGQPANHQQAITNSSSNNLLVANAATPGPRSNSSQATTVSRSQSSQWSLLERQYRLVASFKAKDFCVVSALKPCNKIKNRTLNLIPLEAHRVHITPKPGTDGSDYINATFLMGFNHLHEFIVTQHPVMETFSDFWQMVYDHNSQTIVLLSQMDESLLKEFPQFWPQKEDEVDYGAFKVKLIQESTLLKKDDEHQTTIVARDFIMRSNQDDYELQTRIIHCPGWPDTCGPLSSVFDLIRIVQQATHQQANQQRAHDGMQHSQTVTIGQEHEPQNGGPIIVVDKFGGNEAATFGVLTTLFKQINFEDAVDVYMYAKLAHLRRPGIWQSQDDYLFLYRAMDNYATELLAAQQQAAANQSQSDKQAASRAFGAQLSLPSLHPNQTMTLDRHHSRNKSASAGLKHNTSTMRRPPNQTSSTLQRPSQKQQQQPLYQNVQQLQQQQQQQQLKHTPTAAINHYQQNHSQAIASEFMQVKQSSGGQILKPVATVNAAPVIAATDLNHNNMHYSPGTLPNYQQQQQQHQQHPNHAQLNMSKQQMSKGSPYNSAASIGNVGSHQHLLATNNQQTSRQQTNPSDVFLYTMQ